QEREMVGLLVELDLAADGKAFARHMKGRDIKAEETGKLRLGPESQFAHARMHAVGADGEREGILAAILEARVNGIAPLFERGKRRAVADVDAHRPRALGENALEIWAAQVNIFVVEGAAHAPDRVARVWLSRGVDEFKFVDRIADRAQSRDQTHAVGYVPAAAEEIHHVAFGAQTRLALDHQRRKAAALELEGEREPGDAGSGNKNASQDGP